MEVQESSLKPCPPLIVVTNIEVTDGKYKELIHSLPKEERFPPGLRKYKGFWQFQNAIPGVLAMKEDFKPRCDDVIVSSFPKSGTTWLKALTFTIMHRDKYTFSSHPLLKLNPHDCVPFIELHYSLKNEQYLETLPSPRVLGTHVPYSLLSDSIKTSTCPIIHICRDPKDVIVSFWHMSAKFDWLMEPLSFKQTYELFCEGRVPTGPVWDNVLEYYTKSLSSPKKILILKYAEMLKDPTNSVMRIANFIGCPFSKEEMKSGLVEKIAEFCSFNKLKNFDTKQSEGNLKSYYYRKGIVGDWQNYMTPEMANNLDKITKEKLCDSSFTF
ncbi:Sulfotransferase [Rhynchospora pubera]|uniref:Sulfotransferase n=1 Tax=Rhynchospora pubera TaxID=906938 RepID=A0AAV8FLT6_9POAL|nr:Sulfotransferase [Rhynchospora pubera]